MSWQTYRLGDVITLKRGYDLPEAQRQDGEVPVVSSSGITGYHDEPKAKAPGVVTGRYGTLGEVFYVEQDYWPLNTALYVTDFKGNHPRFVAYFLQNVLRNYQSDKAAVPGVNRNDLHDMMVRSTDRRSQERIADILSAYDDLIENNRRRMALLEEAARQLYREWFVRLRFPGHEHIYITNNVPQGWEIRPLQEVCCEEHGIQTGPFGSQLHQSDYTAEGIPVVMPKDLINFRIATDDIARIPEALCEQLSRHTLQPGDIIYGRRGDIGRRAFITVRQAGWLCGTGCLRLRPNLAVIDARYLFDALGRPETAGAIAARAQGATMPNLNSKVMASVPIVVPPRNFQGHYSDLVAANLEIIENLAEQNTRLKQARDLLLPKLMSGEIAV